MGLVSCRDEDYASEMDRLDRHGGLVVAWTLSSSSHLWLHNRSRLSVWCSRRESCWLL